MSNSPPICFGKRWEAHHPECAGGLDPTYTHPVKNTHVRDRCKWYTSCASRTAANNLGSKLVPPQQLVRHPTPQMPTMPQPFQAVVKGVDQAAQNVRNQAAATVMAVPQMQMPYAHPMIGQPAPMMVHPAHASLPWAVPMNYPAPGMQSPAFLTVPEPIIPGQGLSRPFFATMGRSLLKALGMAAANWFDHVPWNPWPYHQQMYSAPAPNASTSNTTSGT